MECKLQKQAFLKMEEEIQIEDLVPDMVFQTIMLLVTGDVNDVE